MLIIFLIDSSLVFLINVKLGFFFFTYNGDWEKYCSRDNESVVQRSVVDEISAC